MTFYKTKMRASDNPTGPAGIGVCRVSRFGGSRSPNKYPAAIFSALFAFFAVSISGCASPPLTHGIPNFAAVDYGIWRGGQPTPAGWLYLQSLGVTNVVKLNTAEEGSDADAVQLGMSVQNFPITVQEQIFGEPPSLKILRAEQAIGPHTFIHCEHGQDRTGLVSACWRLDHGATKAAAEREMLQLGFHKTEAGLWRFWEERSP